MAIRLEEYLEQRGIPYEVLPHSHTGGSMETAQSAHISGDRLVKGVVLEDEGGYLLALVPATHRIELGRLHKRLDRRLGLATETEVSALFDDCEAGAVPPVGPAYGVDQILDESLLDCSDVYFEAGNHNDLVHVSGKAFRTLTAETPHYPFSRHT